MVAVGHIVTVERTCVPMVAIQHHLSSVRQTNNTAGLDNSNRTTYENERTSILSSRHAHRHTHTTKSIKIEAEGKWKGIQQTLEGMLHRRQQEDV
jgi:hypothetical protein